MTLKLFRESTPWAEAQEREFRVFSVSPNEARLRYKPMPKAQRQFLHVLAEDYGLDSRSEDVEPHRYVVVFKGPRFVSAPGKTLAQCVKIRGAQAAEAAAAEASRPPSPPLPMAAVEPFNAFLLAAPRFGLTVDDVQSALQADFSTQPSMRFAVDFLPSDEVLLRATAHYSAFLNPAAMEQGLTSFKPRLAATIKQTELSESILLCHADSGNHVLRRENLNKHEASGWSAVAGRAAMGKSSPAPAEDVSAKGSGRKVLGLKKKKVEDKKEKAWAAQLDGDVEC